MFIRRTDFHARDTGFTIVELVIFIVIISIAVVGILSVMSFTTSHSGDPQVRKQALSIAEALMEEVSLAKFTYCDPADPDAERATKVADCHTVPEGPGPESGNSRPFDNVNDYAADAVAEHPIAITDVNNAVPGLNNYTAFIAITPQTLNGIPAAASLRIRIRVLYSGAEMVVLEGYRTRYAPTLMP
jgi:MSHA pilin protein MshD